MPQSIGKALIVLHRSSGEVLDCNSAAASLFARSVDELKQTRWPTLLEGEDVSRSGLDTAFSSPRPVSLPTFVVRRSGGDELALAGLVLPCPTHEDRVELLLWPVLGEHPPLSADDVNIGDSIAVLGVDRIRSAPGREEAATRLAEVARHLSEIVRAGDTVFGPVGASLIIVLRGADLESARDISRALLSHLHRTLRRDDSGSFSARLRIGLAQLTPERSVVSTLLAADRAMLQARLSWASQKVRVADSSDFGYLLTDAVQGGGVFVGSVDADEEISAIGAVSAPSGSTPALPTQPQVRPLERDIEGYVIDNMEGAVDQAMFLARLDLPVAIIGPAGTGKMYVARILHEASGAGLTGAGLTGAGLTGAAPRGGPPDTMVQIDCREFRGRKQADTRLARELSRAEGRTLVFKSPHLLHPESQQKLARQISTRRLADVSPARALGKVKFVALFPQSLERLMRKNELTEVLASAFGGFPINVPPIKDRKQAVLRWAHKILGQEGVQRDREIKGFTPDAEQAMLLYDWPGNISEMRQCISDALDKTEKNWLTPVDLGLFDGIDPEGDAYVPESIPYLAAAESGDAEADNYKRSALESLDVALGQAVKNLLALKLIKPLGNWLDDDLVLAALERYRDDLPRTGAFLHTKPRNVSRWLAKIEGREEDRSGSALWQSPRRLVREWVRESATLEESPMSLLQDKLLVHIEEQARALSAARRAKIFGVSTPTYLKRVKEAAR